MPEAAETPAEIQARIARRRQDLKTTLEEIGVRVHPSTVVGDARARVAATVDHTAGRAFVAVNRAVSGVRAQLVSPEGTPRLDRVIPAAVLTVAVAGLLVLSSRRRRR
ncbi:DUF3618 domain-containing protein [Streptomyces litchfieldiae]|uniref:DUF3618 domain-containing protein n=1 Tax=Streptomyces litchfieldiae TaxID=3075543 RepID=A0ABU2MMX3_9ACTN|nr:DUF3618 domain-containing protein [Streptomyces sp. DSM 44938]MDT0342962.1 DUF3618 domain-containing protein [Streptomyces sp. DSM 44938]